MSSVSREELKTIHEYEVAIQRPWNEQIVRKHNGYYTPRISTNPSDLLTYSRDCQRYLYYIHRVNEFSQSVKYHQLSLTSQLLVGETPQYLLELGFQQHSIMYGQRHFRKALSAENDPQDSHQHPLGLNKIRQFAELLDHPLMLADDRSTHDSLLILLPDTDTQGNPLVGYLMPEAKFRGFRENTNQLLTVFGKDHFEQFYERLQQEGKIIWENKKMCCTPGRMSKRQLLGDYPQLSTSDTSLRIPECIVNKYQEGVLAVTPEIETRINKQLHPQLSVQNIATRLNNIVTSSSIKPSMMKPRNRLNR